MNQPSKRNQYNKMPDNQVMQNIAKFMAQSAFVSRSRIAQKLGETYEGDRDVYTALGYKQTITYTDYRGKYDRQDIATRVIDAPVDEVWRKPPAVTNDEDASKETAFEKAWIELEEKHKIYNYFARVDKLSGIGRYAVLFMGFDDSNAGKPETEVTRATNLLYLRPYAEGNVTINTWVTDKSDARFGCPLTYQLTASSAERTGSQDFIVHHSRVLHVTEGMLEDDLFGVPKLENVYNRLDNLELVTGGSSEMFWRGAFPGLNFGLDKDAQMGDQALTDLQDEIEEYMHGLKRYIRTKGMDVESLAQQVADPKGHVDVIVSMIAGAKGMPKRILTGSEMGSLASDQDETNWLNTVDQRRTGFVTPWIVRPFIDRMIELGILTDPGTYNVEWPDIHEVGDKEKVEIQSKRVEILSKYVNALGADTVIPVDTFLVDFLGYKKEEVDSMEAGRQAARDLEKAQMEEDRKRLEEETRRNTQPEED